MTSFEELKARSAEVWSSAPWEQAAYMLAPIHEHLVDRLAPQAGERWLDVATGTGAVALLAAGKGAEVTGVDLAPGLVETAARLAAEDGIDAHFDVGDAEQLPYADSSFDVLSSSMGLIFAPDHVAVARELARVCRLGGRIGFTAWKPETGFLPVSRRYRPPPPPEAGDSDDWSQEEHVRGLLGDAFDLELEHRDWRYEPEPGAALWDRVTWAVGPFKALAESLDDQERQQFHDEFVRYVDGFGDAGVPGDYVLVLGTRR